LRLDSKIAIITGAGSGIGHAAAALFAREGAKVVVADINDTGGQDTVNLIRTTGGEAIFVHTDVTNATEAEQLIRRTMNTYGSLDILYNNAGIPLRPKAVEKIGEDEWDNIFAVNIKGTFLVTKYAIPEMKKTKSGCIINTSSIGAVRARPQWSPYASSKAAVIGFTRALAIELAPYSIRVNCVIPAATDTPIVSLCLPEGTTEEHIEEWKKNMVTTIPLGRMIEPEEVAYAALYLASSDSSMVTGIELNIDGGRGL